MEPSSELESSASLIIGSGSIRKNFLRANATDVTEVPLEKEITCPWDSNASVIEEVVSIEDFTEKSSERLRSNNV